MPPRRSSRKATADNTATSSTTDANTAKNAQSKADGDVKRANEQVEEGGGGDEEHVAKKVKIDEPVEDEEGDKEGTKDEDSEIKGDKSNSKAEDEAGKDEDAVDEDGPQSHGTLEQGHIYFLYRPKVELEEAHSIDEVAKFHILLLPQAEKGQPQVHRVIEIGKKRLPDPDSKHDVLWGLVVNVSDDKASLKDVFGAREYETKTKGTRHVAAARPAGRGHYILHSPRDHSADHPKTGRKSKRDYKTILAYCLTTPDESEMGDVQAELGLRHEACIVVQVKDPAAPSVGNPRAAAIPEDKKPKYSEELSKLFTTKFIPANPPELLSYEGGEILFINSPHPISESLDSESVAKDKLEKPADEDQAGIEEALKELGLRKGDTEVGALEGEWA